MKKFMFVMVSLALFLVGSLQVNASAVLKTEESGNGSMRTSLQFTEGFVGGIDVSIKVVGNVSVDNVVWNSTLPSNYTKRYFYDNNSKVLRIIVTTGDLTKNLVDKNGLFTIGDVKVSSSSTESYRLEIQNSTIVDAVYSSVPMSEVSNGSNADYIIRVDNPVNPSTPDEPSTPSEPSNPNTPTTPNRPSNSGNTSNNTNSSVDENRQDNQDTNLDEQENPTDDGDILDNDKDDEKENNIVTNNKDKNNSNKVSESEEVSSHNKKIIKYLWMVLGGLVIIAVGLAVAYAKKSNKLEKMQ